MKDNVVVSFGTMTEKCGLTFNIAKALLKQIDAMGR